MNYKHVYMLIVNRAKSEQNLGIRKRRNGEYYEKHHILPKSLFPLWTKRKSNLVLLTAREHFFCHQLLTKIYPGKEMSYALYAFINRPNADYKITSREYERIKMLFSKVHSENMKGRVLSKETKEKLSQTKKLFFNENPDKKEEYRKRLYKVNLIARKNKKLKTLKMKNSCPDIIENETIERLKNYDKIFGLTTGIYRSKKVKYICQNCKKSIITGLKVFIGENGKNDFICNSCKASERMKNNNSSVESRHKKGLISEEEYQDYLKRRYKAN